MSENIDLIENTNEENTNSKNSENANVINIGSITNLKTLFTFIADTIANNQDILTFCSEKLSVNAPDIKIGQDPDDLPIAPEGALIFLVPGNRVLTRGESYRAHNISIVAVVKASDSETFTGNIEMLEAIDYVDTIMNLIEKAIFTALQSKCVAITPQAGEADEINYPYGRGVLSYTVEIPVRI